LKPAQARDLEPPVPPAPVVHWARFGSPPWFSWSLHLLSMRSEPPFRRGLGYFRFSQAGSSAGESAVLDQLAALTPRHTSSELGGELAPSFFPPGRQSKFILPEPVAFGVLTLVMLSVPINGGLDPLFHRRGDDSEGLLGLGKIVDIVDRPAHGRRVGLQRVLFADHISGNVGDRTFMAGGFPDQIRPTPQIHDLRHFLLATLKSSSLFSPYY